ncbi:MAG TPA: peptidylprolyl isomerase [Gammaproteobacteria bacterium]|jgi:cyclophilin family peptidyl-prolyl cis-trans isomerase|nr:peptidylprolyl isomerase [Gammaproteobacteria bacterium]
MRASLTALLPLVLLAACDQAQVKPAASSAPPPVTQAAPAPASVVPLPKPVFHMPPPVVVQEVPVDKDHRKVLIQTNFGDITVQLDAKRAPLTVKNFLTYVDERYFDNSSFYRVVPGFVIQGGDFTPDLTNHEARHPAIPNESGNGLSNQRGAIGMGTDEYPHSAQTAFYIDLVNNQKLDPRPDRWGYAVFGQVVDGMDVVDKIAAVQTHTVTLTDKDHSTFNDVPEQPVKIFKVSLLPMPGDATP